MVGAAVGLGVAAWALAAPELASSRLAVVMVSQPGWEQACGIGPGGALLVRPDQIVAWRGQSMPDDLSAVLDVLRGAAGRVSSVPTTDSYEGNTAP